MHSSVFSSFSGLADAAAGVIEHEVLHREPAPRSNLAHHAIHHAVLHHDRACGHEVERLCQYDKIESMLDYTPEFAGMV